MGNRSGDYSPGRALAEDLNNISTGILRKNGSKFNSKRGSESIENLKKSSSPRCLGDGFTLKINNNERKNSLAKSVNFTTAASIALANNSNTFNLSRVGERSNERSPVNSLKGGTIIKNNSTLNNLKTETS